MAEHSILSFSEIDTQHAAQRSCRSDVFLEEDKGADHDVLAARGVEERARVDVRGVEGLTGSRLVVRVEC